MAGWHLTDHVCRICFGRVLSRETTDGATEHRCSNCGATGGDRVTDVCCCGMTLRSGKNAGLRCVKNRNKSDALPSEVVAVAGV